MKHIIKETLRFLLNAERFVVAIVVVFVTLPLFWVINYQKLAKFIKYGSSTICLVVTFVLMFSDIFYTYPIKTFYLFMICFGLWSYHTIYPALKEASM